VLSAMPVGDLDDRRFCREDLDHVVAMPPPPSTVNHGIEYWGVRLGHTQDQPAACVCHSGITTVIPFS
jgi:hypothetical protein